ncbi:kinetochore scaffold 1 isoform X2 [Ochotona princeps]|uniref:kinetochore scaffold 1 isoform X2 n=1 Tax=Ochotona princeps TaxID=9978 RepID=UPI002715228E|nr:kinetochore scaffold 1 isoform X2 [Ochotona princeps]
MDGVSSEANDENDNTERPVRRRHSSILKPPRSPLQDLRGGNEAVQESNVFRSKKSSRRVSFADTIKVFQTESHMKIGRKSETTGTESKENVPFIQSKNSENNYCEITGMSTLLCAPIQTQMQQREFSITESNHERKHADDQTVVFSDENQMDLTASHTVMITKGLLGCTESDKSTKVDTTSFLANLKHHLENSRVKKESDFSVEQNISSEKINCSDFIKRLKTGKYNASFSTGTDKENSEIPIHSKESSSASCIPQTHVPVNIDENSNDRTQIFREQDAGMNFTQCHTANIQMLVPIANDANTREFTGDTAIFGNDCMDLTVNNTIPILPSAGNLSEMEDQSQNVIMDVTTEYAVKVPEKKTACENKQSVVFQNPSRNPEDKMCIIGGHIMETENHTVTQTSNRDTRPLPMTQESVCFSPSSQGYKTIFYSSCNDAMELTKCFSSMREEKILLKHDGSSKICLKADAMPLLEKTIYSEDDNMDITKSHTVAIDNQILKQNQTKGQRAALPVSKKEAVFPSSITVLENGKMNVNYSSIPHALKEGLQQNLSNALSVTLSNEKTELLDRDNMDLTESRTSNLGSQVPVVANLVPENVSKSYCYGKSPSEEWEKMAKSRIELSQQPKIISETESLGKEKDNILRISPCLGKDTSHSVDYNQDTAVSHNVVSCGGLNKQITPGNNSNTVSSDQLSAMKLYSTEEQSAVNTYSTTINSHTVKFVLGQHSKQPDPPKKNLGDCTSDCSYDKMLVCSEEEQNMDLTRSHTVVIGFGNSEIQELDQTNLEHTSQRTTVSKQRTIKLGKCDESAEEITEALVSNNMDALEDKNVQKPGFLKENKNTKIFGRKSFGRLKHDKTVVFSTETGENDMDITRSYTVEINHRPLLDDHDSHLVSLPGTSKTILYTGEQDDMEITRSHTTALECKSVSPGDITTVDKTVMFVDDHDGLEMTECHTVFIDFQAMEKCMLPNFEDSRRRSLRQSKVTSTEEKVPFPESDKSDYKAAKGNSLTIPDEKSNSYPVEKAIAFLTDDNMKVSKPATLKNIKDVQKPGFLNELSGRSQRRKSLRLKNDKAVVFSESDKNDPDTSQVCMMETNKKSALEDRDFHLMPSTSKTVLYSCGQDDMEITRSRTTALVWETASPDKITTRPLNRTVMYVDDQNDLEVTKSHTVFIDCQDTKKIFEEYPKFGTAKGKKGSCFSEDDSCVQEVPTKQELTTENKVFLHTEQKHHMIPIVPHHVLSGNQSEKETMESHRATAGEEVTGKIVGQTSTSEKARVESYHLDSTNREDMNFINSHVAAIGGSNDNYSCLPNAISCFGKLEGNTMSLCDKDKEKCNCPFQNDLAYANTLPCERHVTSETVTASAPCLLLEKQEAIQTSTEGQLQCAITPLTHQDLIEEPQNLLASQTLIHTQNLGEMAKLNSKPVSFKLPKDQMETCVDDTCVASEPHLTTQQPALFPIGQNNVNKDDMKIPKAVDKVLSIVTGFSSTSIHENKSKMLSNKEQFSIGCEKELKENSIVAECKSELTVQAIQTQANARQTSDPVIASNVPYFSNVTPNLNNLIGKIEGLSDFQAVPKSCPQEQSLEVENQTHSKSVAQVTEMHDTVSNNVQDNKNENKNSNNGSETASDQLKALKDKMRRHSLGIFLPRLPNKRNCSITVTDDPEQVAANTTVVNQIESQPASSKESVITSVAAKLNLSPSQFINEEHLPSCPGEINSSDSICLEAEDKTLIETHQNEISPSENKVGETLNQQKRTWVQDEETDIPNEKKIRKRESELNDTTKEQEVFDHQTEESMDRNANSVLIKSLSRTPSSCSSSLDSIKADGTSLDFSTLRNSQMESQFLRDAICEESLKEKLKDGRITMREFFILLQVHILIQKPRQSNLPAKFTIGTPPTPEDLMLRQYVYGPKTEIYKEDCEALRQKIEELKLSSLNQDKLLTDINRNLWEKMRCCSDAELKTFGAYLNKIKSCFTKMTKVFTHQGKVALYGKLVHSAQHEREKLQIRIDEMDSILKKMSNCLTEMEKETNNLEDAEKVNPVEEWSSEMKAAEKELEQLKTEEQVLQRNLAELKFQKAQTLAQIDCMKKQTSRTKELLDQLSLSEWDIIEWSDDQAIFTFVYDTIELNISFGEPIAGLSFLGKASKKITELKFQSLLDDKAPPSSLLVHKLIFQYIEEQESWKKTCTTQHQVPKMLQELSLVMNHCRLLGEEIEFLKRWGTYYNLVNIHVKNTDLTLLFASSAAFAKFEITLYLSARYPSVPVPFTIQNHIGSTRQDSIAAILSKVPLEDNYLKNVVKQIYQDLLHDCHVYH